MKHHPLAEIFPMMDGEDLAGLSADIKANGQLAPVTTYEGMILDGRNRHKACEMAGVEPKFREFTGSDPLQFVLAANLHRRHLTESQRAMVAAKLATLSPGERKSKAANLPISNVPTQKQAAKSLGVSDRSVRDARKVLESPALTKEVEQGKTTVHAAKQAIAKAKVATHPKPEKVIVRDATGYAIPEKILPLWSRRAEVETVLKEISKARCAVKAAHENQDDPLYRPVSLNSILANLNNAYTSLQVAVPYAVCPTCQGQVPEECALCKGRGLISKHHFDRVVPQELKDIRAKSCVTK